MKDSTWLQTRTSVGGAAIALAFAAVVNPSFAQEVQTNAGGAENTAQGPGLEEIVVTAQRRSESILSTPIAITAVTGESLIKSGTDNPLLLGNVVPNLQIQRSVGLQISIRGVSNENSLETGDPSTSYNVDGVYIARQQAMGFSFYDLQRVEVLRGPQGTLYGRNATGGAINLIPNKPTDKFEGNVMLEASDFSVIRGQGMINVPVTDWLALRASFAVNQGDSILLDGPANISGAGLGSDKDDKSVRLQALFTFSPAATLRISADGTDNDALPPMQVPLANLFNEVNPGAGVIFAPGVWANNSSEEIRTVNWNPAFTAENSVEDRGILGEFNYDVGFGTITALVAHRSFKYYKREPVFFLGLGQANRAQPYDNSTDSYELRLASNGDGALKYVVGLYRFEEATDINTQFLPPLPGPLVAPPYNYRMFDNHAEATTSAVFGQATYSFTDEFRLTAGVRYTDDNKWRKGENTRQVAFDYDPATDVALRNDAEVDSNKTTWRLGIEHDLNPDVLLYGTVSTGYKAGGFNDGCLATTPGCNQPVAPDNLFYDPEEITAYEAGIKGRFLEGALQGSLAGFYYDYTDVQLQGINPTTGIVVNSNAASATIYGAELEATWAPTGYDRVTFSGTLLDATYDEYRPTATIDFAGKDLDRSPKYSVQLGYEHVFELSSGWSIVPSISSRYSASSYFSNFSAGIQYQQDAYSRTDVTLTVNAPEDRFYVQGFLNNAEDEVRGSGAVLGATFLTDPRTYGVRLGAKF